jgi:hypothetical protein
MAKSEIHFAFPLEHRRWTMPELYGNPFKSTLYAEVHELRSERLHVYKELRLLRGQLKYAKIRNDELQAQIKRMQEKARAVIDEGDQDIEPVVGDRFIETLRLKRTVQ